jgi:hypothetical protein
MSARGKFTENATGVVVDVEGVFAWAPHPEICVVSYPILLPDGATTHRRYGVPVETFKKQFTMCPNQTIELQAFGSIYDRPLPSQLEE